MNQLEQLKQFTTIVADTCDLQALKLFTPQDTTTNPSLILKAMQKECYKPFLNGIIKQYPKSNVNDIINKLLIIFGVKILHIIPGRVSTETEANLSFDTHGIIDQGRTLIKLYEEAGIERERILIKIAATWEGIQAAKILEKEGIHCNMTLLFTLQQAIACSDVNAQLISPFVGRIYDWYNTKRINNNNYIYKNIDPGVQLVQLIYSYYRKFDCKTEIMGASFRNTLQIIELAGCDLLTISPVLLEKLTTCYTPITCKLDIAMARSSNLKKIKLDEKSFRFSINQNAMATEKLAEGIRLFSADTIKLQELITSIQ